MPSHAGAPFEDRWISLGKGAAKIPERLLLAHARGHVLFITGAGTSRPSGLPDFRELALRVYEHLDMPVYRVLSAIPSDACNHWKASTAGLSEKQCAEVARFVQGEYDVVLGMLERRMDGSSSSTSTVREKVVEILRTVPDISGKLVKARPSLIHKALMGLADRGDATTIITTNFDLLLEAAAGRKHGAIQSHALGAIPRPGRKSSFAGVLHVHGALNANPRTMSEIVVTDHDLGEFYLRRRIVPDFIYDSARLFCLVLVGYSASDAPMRYLFNAVAADGSRFDDLKERFAFVGSSASPDQVLIEDWIGRGVTPIPYESSNSHSALTTTLERWSALSAVNGDPRKIEVLLKRLVRQSRGAASDADRDLFDHLYRRSGPTERVHLSGLISNVGAEQGWLDALLAVDREVNKGPR